MEYIICCLCSLLCFICGVWAARGVRPPREYEEDEETWAAEEDALSRDIAALMAYTGPKKEEDVHEDS